MKHFDTITVWLVGHSQKPAVLNKQMVAFTFIGFCGFGKHSIFNDTGRKHAIGLGMSYIVTFIYKSTLCM